MNKSELIAAMAAENDLTKVDNEKALNAFIESVKEEIKKESKVALIGFGTFSVSERKARTGRNPQTGKEIKIAAKKVVKFKAGADLTL
jgi:DNA-binding protein HU-beta